MYLPQKTLTARILGRGEGPPHSWRDHGQVVHRIIILLPSCAFFIPEHIMKPDSVWLNDSASVRGLGTVCSADRHGLELTA